MSCQLDSADCWLRERPHASRASAPAVHERPYAAGRAVIRLTVPGRLEYRTLVLRVVSAACKLVARDSTEFEQQVVSAFSEAFNNIAIHGYREQGGDVEIEIDGGDDGLTIRMLDHGARFRPELVAAPRLSELPESGMGLYIICSFMDEVTYRPGDPPRTANVLCMTKRLGPSPRSEIGTR
jgi:serine/threonine-protein kinase RsbW